MSEARSRVHSWLAVVTLAALLVGCWNPEPRPSLLILITVDTLRADRLGCYGNELGITPNLDSLAQDSLVFDAAYAPSAFTVPSISALMTGHYPEDLGIWANESGLPDSFSTLAGELRNRGWQTRAVVSNFVLREQSGLASGFDSYDDTFPQLEAYRKLPERIASDTTNAGLDALAGCSTEDGEKCFVWIHYQDPHGPYNATPKRRNHFLMSERHALDGNRELSVDSTGRGIGGIPDYQFSGTSHRVAFYRASYDVEISYMDEQLGRLLEGIEARNQSSEAIIVFAADHGESLGERDYWFAHGEYLTDVLVRVPLLMRVPGRAASRRTDIASLVDLYGTLLTLVTGEPMTSDHRGRDLLAPDAESQASTPYLATLGASSAFRYGVVAGDWKLITSLSEQGIERKLYRRGNDEDEFGASNPQIMRRMTVKLEKMRKSFDTDRIEFRRPKLTDEEREMFRVLGYGDEP